MSAWPAFSSGASLIYGSLQIFCVLFPRAMRGAVRLAGCHTQPPPESPHRADMWRRRRNSYAAMSCVMRENPLFERSELWIFNKIPPYDKMIQTTCVAAIASCVVRYHPNHSKGIVRFQYAVFYTATTFHCCVILPQFFHSCKRFFLFFFAFWIFSMFCTLFIGIISVLL